MIKKLKTCVPLAFLFALGCPTPPDHRVPTPPEKAVADQSSTQVRIVESSDIISTNRSYVENGKLLSCMLQESHRDIPEICQDALNIMYDLKPSLTDKEYDCANEAKNVKTKRLLPFHIRGEDYTGEMRRFGGDKSRERRGDPTQNRRFAAERS